MRLYPDLDTCSVCDIIRGNHLDWGHKFVPNVSYTVPMDTREAMEEVSNATSFRLPSGVDSITVTTPWVDGNLSPLGTEEMKIALGLDPMTDADDDFYRSPSER